MVSSRPLDNESSYVHESLPLYDTIHTHPIYKRLQFRLLDEIDIGAYAKMVRF